MKKAYLILFIFAFAIYSCSGSDSLEPDEKESEQVVEEENLEEPVDTDLDGIPDTEDNCPEIANQDQLDLDEDGLGDLCDACPEDPTNTCNDCIDADGDGFLDASCGGDDCDDADGEIFPGAEEVCDGVDNNCDTEIDEGVLSIFYLDQDGDVYGDPAKEIEACSASEGYVENNKDQFPEDPNKVDGSDSDKDRVDDLVDNCPDIYNPNQFDICSFSKTLEVGPDENINDVINNNEEEEHLLILLTGNTYNISTPINIINRNISIMPKENDQEVTLINDELSSTYMIKIDLNDGLENNFVNISNLKIDCDLDIAAIELKAGQSDHITFSELTILKGKADYPRRYGAGISLFAYEDSLVNIVNNTFAENSIERATYGAIFLWTEDNSVINVNANTFLSNSNILFASILKAGAFDSSKINITNNRFQDNTGDGMEIVVCPADNSKLKIINNTLSGNNDLATGVHLNYIGDDRTGTVELINNIIANYVVRGIQIYSDVKGPLLIKNNGFFNNNNCHINKPSCIDDEELQDFIDFGDGNIVCDPDFDADLRISENSECGDVGINSVLNDPDIGNFVRFDKEGNERAVNGNIIDLGAYEVQ